MSKEKNDLLSLNNMKSIVDITNVQRSLRMKMMVAVIISLLISSPISAYINSYVKNFIDGNFGVYINTIITLVVSTIIIILFIQYIVIKPLNKVLAATKEASKGNLNSTVDHKSNDEIGQLSNAFNEMIDNLRSIIQKTNDTVLQVSTYSEELNISAEENSKAIEQISSSIQDVVLGSENQLNNTVELTKTAQEITNKMEDSSSTIRSVANVSSTVSEKADSGVETVTHTIEQMDLVQNSVKETSNLVYELGSKSTEIGNIVGIISQIADQTNLLALNASIEAARAGEHGKSFAVVADEVRKLAEQSRLASGNIQILIEEIQKEINHAIESMMNGQEIVEKGTLMVNQTGDSFKEIVKDIQEVSEQTNQVAMIVEEVNTFSQGITKLIENIASITENVTGSTQQVASAIEEQTASMEEISGSSAMLNNMSKDLQAEIRKFQI